MWAKKEPRDPTRSQTESGTVTETATEMTEGIGTEGAKEEMIQPHTARAKEVKLTVLLYLSIFRMFLFFLRFDVTYGFREKR